MGKERRRDGRRDIDKLCSGALAEGPEDKGDPQVRRRSQAIQSDIGAVIGSGAALLTADGAVRNRDSALREVMFGRAGWRRNGQRCCRCSRREVFRCRRHPALGGVGGRVHGGAGAGCFGVSRRSGVPAPADSDALTVGLGYDQHLVGGHIGQRA